MKTFLRFCFLFAGWLLATGAGAQEVPAMSSYPSAKATIFLDFDGHTVEGTSWNFTGPIYCGPSNLTVAQVVEIFNRVSEDYRPFNVNITTDSTKYWAAPANQRMRVIHTVSSDWYGNAGGVSYYGSFTWGNNTPAFVFTALLNLNTKYIAEASAHEAGHSLGLRHQSTWDGSCNKIEEYNSGVGSGEIGWAPIMGVGYYRNQTLWNTGTDPNACNSIQNDLEMITLNNGFGFREDDHSASFGGNGEQVSFSADKFAIQGVIEQSSDADVFRFTMPRSSRFTLDALPFGAGPNNSGANLDLQVELMTSANNVVRTYNPDRVLQSSIDTNLNAGTYFLRVQGKGNAYAPQFASLGSYTLQAQMAAPVVLPLRRLELQGRQVNSTHAFVWAIDADEAVLSQVLETSSNGKDFMAAATPTAGERSQTLAAAAGTRYYRLAVRFDNGRQYYSNVVVLRNDGNQKPYLLQNQVQHSLLVNSPAVYQYQVSDYNGRVVSKGQVQKGTAAINCQQWSGGYYIIQLSNGQDQYSYKFLKQ